MRIRTVLMLDPSAAGLDEALASPADAIALTVSDAGQAVGALRLRAGEALPRIRAAGKLALVVVNHPRTRLLRDDLDALVMPDLSAVFLPHTTEPQDLRDLAVLLREFEYTRGMEPGTVGAFPLIDTARGLVRAVEIAQAVPRVRGLVFDSPGYAGDIGARDEEHGPRFAHARGAVVAAARATDSLPLIRTHGFDSVALGHYGFAGLVCVDARVAGPANAAFTPTQLEIERAHAQIAAYAAARAEGAWAARLGAQIVEAHTARRAQQLLDQAGVSTG